VIGNEGGEAMAKLNIKRIRTVANGIFRLLKQVTKEERTAILFALYTASMSKLTKDERKRITRIVDRVAQELKSDRMRSEEEKRSVAVRRKVLGGLAFMSALLAITFSFATLVGYLPLLVGISLTMSCALAAGVAFISKRRLSDVKEEFFKGTIDEVRIYNRALTKDELSKKAISRKRRNRGNDDLRPLFGFLLSGSFILMGFILLDHLGFWAAISSFSVAIVAFLGGTAHLLRRGKFRRR